MQYHYTYKIINLVNNKIYIGKHSTNDLDDGYMGSGISIKNAIKKYGIDNFSKEILNFYNSSEEALNAEKLLVTPEFVDNRNNYNMRSGGIGCAYMSEEVRNKISETLKIYYKDHPQSEETRLKKSEKAKNNQAFAGHKHSEESKQKIRLKSIGRYHSEESKQKMRLKALGHKLSEESKQKIRESKKGQIAWNKGKHYFNNGIIEILSNECPDGFVKGKLKKNKP